MISVVVPCYRCDTFLEELCRRLEAVLLPLEQEFEVVLVNDQSPADDWAVIQRLTQAHPWVRGINLSRNFGQHYAISAGLDQAAGDWVVIMDGDLQDRPEEIPLLYQTAQQQGFDSVFAQREVRSDLFWRRWSSSAFYSLLSYLTNTHQDASVANFGIYRRCVVDAVRGLPETFRYYPVMIRWVGFRQGSLPVTHGRREGTASSYTLTKMLSLALDVMIAFSDKPIRLLAQLGLLLAMVSAAVAIYVFIRHLRGTILVEGWASLMMGVGFVGGLNMLLLGIIGIYVGKVFAETKRRPLYIVKDTLNGELPPFPVSFSQKSCSTSQSPASAPDDSVDDTAAAEPASEHSDRC